jgi:NADH-ubiquinone oxidoreductase chain 4L
MSLALILLTIGILGYIFNRKNLILMFISIEIILLAVTVLILITSLSFNDIVGELYGIFIIAVAGAETAVGLAILLAYFKLRNVTY